MNTKGRMNFSYVLFMLRKYKRVRYNNHTMSGCWGIKMNVSNRIKEIRAITGLTRKDFSDKYGIPLRTLEEWEAGRRYQKMAVI